MVVPGPVLAAGVYRQPPTEHRWPDRPAPQPQDLEEALALVRATEPVTPLTPSAPLSERFDREVLLKLEPNSPVRSFKHRGALAAVKRIVNDTNATAVITASTGNHGQGVAYAASRYGLASVVYSPNGTVREKLDAMRNLGAKVRIQGANLGEAQEIALASSDSASVYIEDGENPDLMAGAATVALEILHQDEGLDAIIVPIGGGNLIAGSLLSRKHFGSAVEIVGVQSSAASASTQSWLHGEFVESLCSTFAGGLATTRPGHLALGVMIDFLRQSVVDEHDLYRAIGTASANAELQLEGAAASPIAALERFGTDIQGERIALVITGDWISDEEKMRSIETFTQC